MSSEAWAGASFVCGGCGRRFSVETREWRCPDCGNAFLLQGMPPFQRHAVDIRIQSLWRYHSGVAAETRVTLGEGCTPLVGAAGSMPGILYKLEYLNPTGSFKDRGMSFLLTFLRACSVAQVVEDSSGNAAASVAAYAARAAVGAQVFVPSYTSPRKLAQVSAHGAEVVSVSGTRADAARSAEAAARAGTYYASHYWNPFVLEGLKTFAYEVVEQLDWRCPDNIVLPCGHGTLFLGTYYGLRALQGAGVIAKMPRLFCVQAEACAPIARAFSVGAECASPVIPAETLAEGIRIAEPARGAEVLTALYTTKGQALAVGEDDIVRAQGELSRAGFFVEMTSAVAVAGLCHLTQRGAIQRNELTIVGLTGSGLKMR